VDNFSDTFDMKVGQLVKPHQPRQFVGAENLELMENAVRYTAYVGKLVGDALPPTGNILEFGAGSGSQTSHVMSPEPRLTCVEINPDLQQVLRSRGYLSASSLDEVVPLSQACVYSINCLEHVENDADVLQAIRGLLQDNGKIVLYVPALQILFSSMDRLVGHHRRYERRKLIDLVSSAGFTVVEARYVDSFGVIPSLLYKLIPKTSGEPSARSIKIYDALLFPVSLFLDRFFGKAFGKNLFLVAVKK
jgi:SAM-dependent methyltransferase